MPNVAFFINSSESCLLAICYY